MLVNFGQYTTSKVSAQINMGYANGDAVREVLAMIATGSDNVDQSSLFSTFTKQNVAIIATALQHISAKVQEAVMSPLFNQDQWVSVMDSKTTAICRSRNGNVYPSDEGPWPPAHWNCRSKRIPLMSDSTLEDLPDTFGEWAGGQPEEFLSDALGATLAERILSEDRNKDTLSINDVALPLTPSAFGEKLNLITM